MTETASEQLEKRGKSSRDSCCGGSRGIRVDAGVRRKLNAVALVGFARAGPRDDVVRRLGMGSKVNIAGGLREGGHETAGVRHIRGGSTG